MYVSILYMLNIFELLNKVNSGRMYRQALLEFKRTYKALYQENKTNGRVKESFNKRASFICSTVINNKRNVLNPFLSKKNVEDFINNTEDYNVVKLNSKSLEALNLGFACFKNEYEYEYNGSNQILLKSVNIEFKGLKYSCLLLGVLLLDGFNVFLIFRDYSVFFKLYIYDTLSISKKALKEEFIELTEEEEYVLRVLNSNKRAFFSTEERIEYFKFQIELYTEKLTEALLKHERTEKRLKNNIKYCKQLKRSNKNVELFLERRNEYKKFLDIFESQISVFYDKIIYYKKRLQEEENSLDAFKSSDNYSETVFEDYESFKYSFKELKDLGLLD